MTKSPNRKDIYSGMTYNIPSITLTPEQLKSVEAAAGFSLKPTFVSELQAALEDFIAGHGINNNAPTREGTSKELAYISLHIDAVFEFLANTPTAERKAAKVKIDSELYDMARPPVQDSTLRQVMSFSSPPPVTVSEWLKDVEAHKEGEPLLNVDDLLHLVSYYKAAVDRAISSHNTLSADDVGGKIKDECLNRFLSTLQKLFKTHGGKINNRRNFFQQVMLLLPEDYRPFPSDLSNWETVSKRIDRAVKGSGD